MLQAVKAEDVIGSSPFNSNSYPFSSVLDFCEVEKSSLGFMELLGVQEFSPLLDLPQLSTMAASAPKDPSETAKERSEQLNQQPATPNSSSISSASSEALNDDKHKQEQQNTKKELKVKKTNQKRQKEPRFAFMTKSEVDHLEDGYRWRKYGQKAVKNSPFPRSYYRCTSSPCNVKKRVERSFNDPSIVVTTYEGQHTHPSPVVPRSTIAGAPGISATSFGSAMPGNLFQYQQRNHQQQQQVLLSTLSSLCFPYNYNDFPRERRLCNAGTMPAFLSDNGLLQDIVPSHMLKED